MPKVLHIPYCVYCGNSAEGRDYFIPISKELPTDLNFELPCCTECNSSAGGRYFESFDQKANWVLDRRIARARPINWSLLVRLSSLVALAIRLYKVSPIKYSFKEVASDKYRRKKALGLPRDFTPPKGPHRATKEEINKILRNLQQTNPLPFKIEYTQSHRNKGQET